MSYNQITYTDKVTGGADPQGQWQKDDANEVKTKHNALDTLFATEHTSGGTHTAATSAAAGFMSAADKSKLDGIETGADVTDAGNVSGAGAVMTNTTNVSGSSWVLDEDNMSSDSNQKVPTQQSVKAYVDTTVTANTSGKANTSHTHAASAVTSGTFDDARIAESNVTQHQDALSIGSDQVVASTVTASGSTLTLTVNDHDNTIIYCTASGGCTVTHTISGASGFSCVVVSEGSTGVTFDSGVTYKFNSIEFGTDTDYSLPSGGICSVVGSTNDNNLKVIGDV